MATNIIGDQYEENLSLLHLLTYFSFVAMKDVRGK